MSAEGRVQIHLPRIAGGPVHVVLHEPGNVTGILCGLSPQEALRIVPALFSVCAVAQSHAAVSALEAALAIPFNPGTAAARQALTAMEALREHLLRIVLDWPEFLGVAATGAGARPAMGLARRLACALFGGADPFSLGARAVPDVELAAEVIADAEEILVQIVFGEPLAHWLDRRGEAGLCEWTRDTDTPASALVAHVLASGLTAAPTPLRRPCAADLPGLLKTWLASNCGPLGDGISNVHALSETTPLSRRAGHPLVACLGSGGLAARLVARLVELASLPGELRRLVRNCGPVAERFALEGTSGGGAGIAAVEAARGRLLHAVRIADAKVAAWAILPPTRVNFATDGIAARCLAAMPEAPDGDRLDLARLYVNAIDPCVACDVRIH